MEPTKKRQPRAPWVDLDVTAEIIALAEHRDSGHCMIADALRAAVPDATFPAVDLQTIRFTDPKKGLRYVYLTPRRAQVALVDFDQERHNEPFKLRIRSGSVMRSGRRPKGKATIVFRNKTAGTAPEVVGGPVPPRAALSSSVRGQRRQFGLRGFER